MSAELIILVLLIVTALAFDFTNGFHDTGNAMATSIATGALKPKTAVLLAGVLNLVGAFLSVEVAVTVTTSVLKVQDGKTGALIPGIDASTGLTIIFAGLVGGILWNLLTWLFGIPSSSSHALFGGLIGAGLAALGMAGVNWSGVTGKVLIPAVAAPLIACLVAACGTWLVYRITRNVVEKPAPRGLPLGSDRDRLAGRVVARNQRRAEDDGRHRTRAHHHRSPDGRREGTGPAVLDHLQLRASPSASAPTSAAGASSARWARGSWRSSRLRASPPKLPRPPSF